MAWIRISALREGAVLARPLVDRSLRVVVAAGVPLRRADVERAQHASLTEVEIVDAITDRGVAGGKTTDEAEVDMAYRNTDREHPAVRRLAEVTLARRQSRGGKRRRAA